jgi:hypothetical protein
MDYLIEHYGLIDPSKYFSTDIAEIFRT